MKMFFKKSGCQFGTVFFLVMNLVALGASLLTVAIALICSRQGITSHLPAILIASFLILYSLLSHFAARQLGNVPLAKIEELIKAAQEVAKGHFEVRIDEHMLIGKARTMAESFNLMAEELAKIELFRTDFIENVSHEYKTPLMAIEGYTALLRNEKLSDEKRMEYTQKILDNTRRLSQLSGNILLLSRLEHQEQHLEKEPFRLDEQLREVILALENQWAGKKLIMDIDLENCVFVGNIDFLAIAWQNIIGNAVKFTPEGGTVSVRLKKNANELTVSIADSGPGMSKETLARIFEKYYQGDTSRFFRGNGLGLTLARRTVDLHGGSIEVKSQPGKGTVFIVHLCIEVSSSISESE